MKEILFYEVGVFIIISSLLFQLDNYATIDMFYSLVAIVVVFIMIVYARKSIRFIWKYITIMILFYVFIICNTILNDGSMNVYGQISQCLKNVALMGILMKSSKFGFLTPFKILSKVLFVIIFLNFFQIVFFPTVMGLKNGEFLYLISSNYNQFGGTMLVGCLSGFVLANTKNRNGILYYLILLFSLLTVLYCGSVTASVGLLLLCLYYLVVRRNKILSKFSVLFMFIVIMFIFSDFVLGASKMFGNISLLEKFFDLTEKDPTFNGRTKVWEMSVYMFLNNCISGIGLYAGDEARFLLGASNSHNIFLDLLLVGGGLLFVSICILIYCLIRAMKRFLFDDYYYGMLFCFEIYILMMQFEVYLYCMIFLFLFLMYYSLRIKEFCKLNNI